MIHAIECMQTFFSLCIVAGAVQVIYNMQFHLMFLLWKQSLMLIDLKPFLFKATLPLQIFSI